MGRPLLLPLIAGAALAVTAVAAAVALDVGWPVFVATYTLTNVVIGAGFLASGGLICWHRSSNVVGRLFLVCGLGHLLTAAAGMLAFVPGLPTAVLRALVFVHAGAWQLGISGLFPLAMLLFPDGRLPSPRWRPLAWVIVLSGAYQLGTGVLSDTPEPLGGNPLAQSILSVGLAVPPLVSDVAGAVNAVMSLGVVASLVGRYRRGTEQIRSQLQWIVLAVLAMLVLNTQRWLTGDGPVLLLLSFTLVPIAVAIAIVRHRLLDIRLVLSRTLLYGLTIAVVVAAYAGGVAVVSLLVPAAERGLSVVVAIVAAIAFTPVRIGLQRVIDRAFYGNRSDPAVSAATVAERLRLDGSDLAGVLDQARSALRVPYLAVLRDGTAIAASGAPGDVVDLPLRSGGELVETLRVGLRRGDRTLHAADRRALDLIGLPLALTLQVQGARAATVEARERERVRLQRELHDGLGPSLTSIAFRADAASNLLRTDPEHAAQLLTEIRGGLRDALVDVRRVVYGLRPVELDMLGLVEVLRRHAAGQDGREIVVHADDGLPDLSPAVELAAYRMVVEAITNVLRHSDATRCDVTLVGADSLTITVADNGTPPADWLAGVGLRSIVDRAEELGGRASAGPGRDGWLVQARFPLHGERSASPSRSAPA